MKITSSKVAGATINPMESCLSCIYCWNDRINDMRGWDKSDLGIDTDVTELVRQVWRGQVPKVYPEQKCQFYYVEDRWLQYSAKCDGFHKALQGTPRGILQALNIVGLGDNLRILSKRNYSHFLDAVPKGAYCGVSLTTWDKEISETFEWAGAIPAERIDVLKKAHELGRTTWISAEPMLEGADLARLVEEIPFLRQIYVGILTGSKEKEHPELGMIEIPGLSKHEIISQFREAIQTAKDHAPHMQIFLKNQLSDNTAGSGIKLTKKIWREEGYYPETMYRIGVLE